MYEYIEFSFKFRKYLLKKKKKDEMKILKIERFFINFVRVCLLLDYIL